MYIKVGQIKLSTNDFLNESHFKEMPSGVYVVHTEKGGQHLVFFNGHNREAPIVTPIAPINENFPDQIFINDLQKIPNGIISEENRFETKCGQVFAELPIESSASYLHDGKVSEDFVLKMCDLFLNGSKKSIQRGVDEINKRL